ncbi:MAG: hypothetical protein HY670_00350 [Chloroflexi bacterium]|nr:hypothetical protein [Chloroflexota bacterium]
MTSETYLVKRIEMMQEELERLKRTILRKGLVQPAVLRGIWRGIDFSDEEIEEAKRSWVKE